MSRPLTDFELSVPYDADRRFNRLPGLSDAGGAMDTYRGYKKNGLIVSGDEEEESTDVKLLPFGDRYLDFIERDPAEDKPLNILTGSVRSAKTWAMIPKIVSLLSYPVKGRRIITGASKTTIFENVLNDLFDVIGPSNYTWSAHSGVLTLFGQRWRVIGAKDEGSEKYIRGSTIGVAYCDELSLMPQQFFQMLLTRMSPKGARFYATTNPDSPHHWLKETVLDKAEIQQDLYQQSFTLEDNPNLDEAYKERTKRTYTGVFYQRFILGLWVLAQGAIYRDVLSAENYYTNATRPSTLLAQNGHVEHWIAVDYGTVNPCVFIDIYDDGNVAWWDREYYWDSRETHLQKTDAQYADDLMEFIGPNVDPRWWPGIIVDPSAASFKVELNRRGLMVLDAENTVASGINRVSTMLSRKKIRINIDNTKMGVREMQNYSWDEKEAKSGGTERPIKSHDHYPDAGRYWCETRIPDWRLQI